MSGKRVYQDLGTWRKWRGTIRAVVEVVCATSQ
jgi:hypothetical protein